MPLYKIKDVNFDNIPLIDQSHLRVMWSKVIMHANIFHMENQISPKIYVGAEAFDVISLSTSFLFRNPKSSEIVDYKGHFMEWDVFLSNELIDDEYVIGLDEREVKICKRKDKLNKLINKLCGRITEEKQK